MSNSSLGGLRFGKDGDGNYGYYGADGSLVPFKKGISTFSGVGYIDGRITEHENKGWFSGFDVKNYKKITLEIGNAFPSTTNTYPLDVRVYKVNFLFNGFTPTPTNTPSGGTLLGTCSRPQGSSGKVTLQIDVSGADYILLQLSSISATWISYNVSFE